MNMLVLAAKTEYQILGGFNSSYFSQFWRLKFKISMPVSLDGGPLPGLQIALF